jgi:FtsH-binding integral membrane protein
VSDARPQAGWRDVLLVAAIVLLGVLVAAAVTGLVPPLADAVGHTPLTILVLVAGTAIVLWRLASRPPRG